MSWFFKILGLSSVSYFSKMMSIAKNFEFFSHFGSLKFFKLGFHTRVHIGIVHLHQTQSLAWSLRNNQDCILSLTFPFLLPTVVSF